jgi:hypothetical protein
MDYIENKSLEEMTQIVENINKYLLANDYENAFAMFLLQMGRLNSLDRTDLIKYFNNYFRTRCIKNNEKHISSSNIFV